MSRSERVLHPDRSARDRFGYELRRLRKEHGYSLTRLASKVYVSADLIQRIETAERRAGRELAGQLDKTLQAGGALLECWQKVSDESRAREVACVCGSLPESCSQPARAAERAFRISESAEVDDMNRRELLRIMSMAGALIAIDPVQNRMDWERLDYYANQAGKLDDQVLDEFAALNTNLWHVFVLSRTKKSVLPLVRDQLDVLINNIDRADSQGVHQRMCELISSLFQLSGEILFDGNQYTEAAHCYALAATAGKEANKPDLWACALTRHAYIGVYERRFDKAAPMLGLAAILARRGDGSLATRHWVAAVQAQTFAGLGDLAACQRALDEAEQVYNLHGEIQNGGWLRFDGSRLAEERGTCYIQLKRLDLAEPALTDALSQNLSARRRGSVLTDLAVLGAQRRDIDQVITYADAAVETVRRTGSGVIIRKLIGLQPYLIHFMSDGRARDLRKSIETLASNVTDR